jgi:hypothetical protein
VYLTEASRSENPAAAANIARFLTDADPDIVGQASFYLGSLRARAYLPALTALLTNKNERIVNMAGAGLREMVDERDTALLPQLYPMLQHRFKQARISALECIGRIGSSDSTLRVLARLPVEDFGTQWYVVQALGSIKDPKALPALEARLVEVKAMTPVPYRGGSRGDPPTPALMQAALEEAIENIRSDVLAGADDGDGSWLHSRGSSQRAGWASLSPVRMEGVSSWHLAEAIHLLDQVSFHKLTGQDAEHLDMGNATRAGRSAYLVRAVSNARTRREFTVLTNGSAIVVQQNSFARRTTFQPDAVVVFLDEAPSDVFVEASVTQKPDISLPTPILE